MNHYMDFDPYLIRERNEVLLGEVSKYRLEERLRRERRPSASRIGAFISKSTLPVLRRMGFVEH